MSSTTRDRTAVLNDALEEYVHHRDLANEKLWDAWERYGEPLEGIAEAHVHATLALAAATLFNANSNARTPEP